MTFPRVLTESLGGSKLSQAMQRGEIAAIGEAWPRDSAGWTARATDVRERFRGGDWLRKLAPAFGEGASLPALQRAASDGVIVTTGQQAALFGGPMLTLVKALSARSLATSIERATGVPCATVFWAATDDADFVEAASVLIPGTGAAQTLTLPATAPAGTPMSKVPIRAVEPLLAAMAAVAGSSGEAGIESLRRFYRDGATIGHAYVGFMRELLAPWGIAVLDASHPAVLEAAKPLVSSALAGSAEIETRLGAWTAGLERQGLRPQVESVPGLSLVFANEGAGKRRVPVAEAASVAASGVPLSPNVLLRPVVEAAILPTVAYAAGPGEIAYFAQIAPIAEALNARRPVAVPRWSTTVVEPSVDRILERNGVTIADLKDFDGLVTRLVRARMPQDLLAPLTELRAQIERATTALAAGAGKHGVPSGIIEGIQAQLSLRLDRGERRIVAALKRNETELRRDLGTARASLYPEGVRQERALSFVPFVARYGDPLIERMLVEAGVHADRLVGSAVSAPLASAGAR
ncbi:MAG TPA: bacillithiol biosynthesis BshC [Gemmatimonadaceae bacterium]|nr:bacillithiol biosynthesis BshC [Gemmatimonadaceae bacterium]